MEDFLWDLIPWGYQILLSIQEWRTPLLDSFFSAVTELGSENFYIILFALLYWCFSKRIGAGIAYGALFSAAINATIKDYFDIPRPTSPDLDTVLDDAGIVERATPLWDETSPSWPSNHSQGITVMWGYLAYQVRKGWLWILAITLILLVAFSRWRVERCFQDQKSELGLDDYEGRRYLGLKRHLVLASVSYLFLAQVHQGLRGKKPGVDRSPSPHRRRRARAIVVA